MKSEESNEWCAGSWHGIFYQFCQLLDELLHGLENLGFSFGDWRYRFCQWCYRRDWHQDMEWSKPFLENEKYYIEGDWHGIKEKICLGNGVWIDWDVLKELGGME
jgi:hypothetical protein